MKKNKYFKRSICAAMSIVVVLSMIAGDIPGALFARKAMAADNVTYSPKKPGGKILPAAASANTQFMNQYVLKGDFNNNNNFIASELTNINKDAKVSREQSLSRHTNFKHQDNNHWEAVYHYIFNNDTAMKDLVKNNQITVGYDGNITADYHKHIGVHKDKLWDNGVVRIRGMYTSVSGKDIIFKKCDSKNDGQGQHYSLKGSAGNLGVNQWYIGISFIATHSGCNCGSSAVGQSVIYLEDTSAPYVKSTYVTSDKDGNNKVSGGAGFKAGQKGYVVLEFNEYIRFANNNKEQLSLNLDIFNTENNQQITAGGISADLVSVKDDKMIFEFAVPEKINGNPTNVYISSVSGTQDWAGKNQSTFDCVMVDENGNVFDVNKDIFDLKSGSKITDLAGNGINWSGSNKSMENKTYLDNVNPELCKIKVSGSMITESSSLSQEDWNDDIDRSAVFAGVGDTLVFSACFTEELKNINKNEFVAALNINDASGSQVHIKASKTESINAKSELGVNAMSEKITKVTFEPITITEGMVAQTADGKPIRIMGISGGNNVTDLCGNKLKSVSSINLIPMQKEYLDTLPAVASTSLIKADGETKYTPISVKQEEFTFPITVNDDTSADNGVGGYASGVTGLEGSFSLATEGDAKDFLWYVDTNQGIDSKQWKTGTTGKKYPLLQMEGSNTAYIHIKLNKFVDYNYTDLTWFEANLEINTLDYAGNKKTYLFPIKHNADTEKSTVEDVGYTVKAAADGKSAVIKTNLKMSDNFGIKKVEYYFEGDESNKSSQEWTDEQVQKSIEIQPETTISLETEKTGSRKLILIITDAGGNQTTYSKEYTYNLSKPVSDYIIGKSSISEPVCFPEVSVNKPDSVEIAEGTQKSVKTMLLIPVEVNSGVTTYYAFIPSKAGTESADRIFFNMPETAEQSNKYNYFSNYWYKLTGSITDTSTTLQSVEALNSERVCEITEYIENKCGTQEIIFVTSSDITFNDNDISFTNAYTTIETETVYLIGNIQYDIKFTDVRDAKDNSIKEALSYTDGNGNPPVSTLDGASFVINMENITENAGVDYGLNGIDFNRSYVELKCSDNNSRVRTMKLEKAQEQRITIPEGVVNATGNYVLNVSLYTINGKNIVFTSDNCFVDTYSENVFIDKYNKKYVNTYYSNDNYQVITVREDSELENATELSVGLAEVPKGFILSSKENENAVHEIVFGRSKRNAIDGLTENVKIKVWSKQDANGEVNAQWINFDNTSVSYEPVLTEEFTPECYQNEGNPVLPLKDGDNLVCYQMMNTNGTVVTKEIMINVFSMASEFTLNTEWSDTQVLVRPEVTDKVKLLNPKFRSGTYAYPTDQSTELYEYTILSSGNYCYYMYDMYGNLYMQELEVEDVDGVFPFCGVYVNKDYADASVMGNGFHFKVTGNDDVDISEGEVYLTFDTDYSALLMGLTGEARTNNTEQITVKVPVNIEGDKVWQEFDSKYYGIYRTEITEERRDEQGRLKGYDLEIWGSFRYDDTREEYDSIERTFTISVCDKKGNMSSENGTKSYQNILPVLSIGAPDERGHVWYSTNYLDENGNLGVYSTTALKSINSYGAGKINMDKWIEYYSTYYTSLSMIFTDGIYEVEFVDLFDDVYRQDITVNVFNSPDIEIKFSETEYTNQNVVVTAKALNPGDTIVSIVGDVEGSQISGSINEQDKSTGSIIMTDNGTVTVTTALGKTHTVKVINIDKVLEPAKIVYSYNGAAEPEFIEGSSDTVADVISAILVCDESVDGTNGKLTHTFKKGSKAGTEYTFEYKDKAGNTGSMTAVLPYNIKEDSSAEPGEKDVTSPSYTMNVYGMRNQHYDYLADFYEGTHGKDISDIMNQYKSQKYSMIFDITDDSKTKIIIKNIGSPAPQSYSDESDVVNGVSVDGTMITVTENTEFDVYVIDSADNVTALTGMNVQGIDNVAPKVKVQYESIKDYNGITIARAYFVPANEEKIIAADTSADTPLTMMIGIKDENDDTHYVTRYYKDFYENEKYTFTYKDTYGNIASVTADVNGVDNVNPVVTVLKWYGSYNNVEPEKSSVVNRNITASMTISKAVNEVRLYWYDETKDNKKGEEITDTDKILTTFVDKNVDITFKANTDKKVLAEIFASSNGKFVMTVLPEVRCIDKEVPEVSVQKEELSSDKTFKTYTFTTNEETMMSEAGTKFSTEHKWTANKSGTAKLKFTDRAGNVNVYEINVTEVDDMLLDLSFSKNADGSGAVNSPEELKLAISDTVYIMSNKAAFIEAGSDSANVSAGVWTAFKLNSESGFCSVKAVDSNTGKTIYRNIVIDIKDTTAPVIVFDESIVYIQADSSMEDLMKAVKSGVTVKDNKDGIISDYDISGMPDSTDGGSCVITYKASDKAGNKASANRTLYIYSKNVPLIKINGKATQPLGTVILDSKSVSLEIENMEKQPVTIKWKAGIKTSGQMKKGAEYVKDMTSFSVPKSGFYTIYVRTQDRKEFVTYIYVKG